MPEKRFSPLVVRLLVLAALVVIYISFDWFSLRAVLAAASAWVLALLGQTAGVATQGEAVFLTFSDKRVLITPACTYVDLVFILMPFTWRVGRGLWTNLFRIATVTLAVLSMNMVRLVIAAALHGGGMAWTLSHDLPDYAFYYMAIAGAVLLCARSDWRLPQAGAVAGNA